MNDPVIWQPDPDLARESNLAQFMNEHGIDSYDDLLKRSDSEPEWFWRAILSKVVFERAFSRLVDESRGPPFASWCVGGRSNVVTSCLERHRGTDIWGRNAIVHESEDREIRRWSYAELSSEVDALANGLRSIGCRPGDVIGLYMPNLPETIAAFLAIAKIGAVVLPLFSGFGASALTTRLSDASASTVITVDSTRRRGTRVPMKSVLDEAAAALPHLRRMVVLRSKESDGNLTPGRDHDYRDLIKGGAGPSPIEIVDSDSPMMLIYTSGTTGKPKGTVHSHISFLGKMILDMGLMLDLKSSDRLLWISDMGWLVGPIIAISSTFQGACAVLVEGGPDYPDSGRMWRLIQQHGITFLGIAPTISRAFIKAGGGNIERYDLSSLRIVVSTGEVWTPEAWHWTFEKVCNKRAPILNYSGGTEVGGGILSGTVLHPLKPCAFSAAIPGMKADIVDEGGRSVGTGVVGELVMRGPSIGLSRSLWRDDARYLESYWEAIPGIWRQGDWAVRDQDGFWYIKGRSDDTLKIAGKRTGPSEIEAALAGTGAVAESAAIGIPDAIKGEAVGCFVTLMPGIEWSDSLRRKLEEAVVRDLGPPYRPAIILPVSDLPKTRSLKVMRRVVRATCIGENPGDLSSLVNPDSVREIADAVGHLNIVRAESAQ
jgi:acetyl-CoA synthetase